MLSSCLFCFQNRFGACLMVSIAVKRHHDHGKSYKGWHLTDVAASNFRSLIHYHHEGIIALSKYTWCWKSCYTLIRRQQEGDWLTVHYVSIYKPSKSTSTVPYFFQHSHTYSNKAILSISATPFRCHFLSTTTQLKRSFRIKSSFCAWSVSGISSQHPYGAL